MAINFDSELRAYIQNWYNYFGIVNKHASIKTSLENLSTLRGKYILPVPRKVDFANELVEQLMERPMLEKSVKYLEKLFTEGKNVNRHQSKYVLNHYVPDHLVYDWKIYHLHLSEHTDKSRKHLNKRTDDMLFTYIEQDRVLFLGIFKHKPDSNFSNVRLLEILDNNWKGVLQEADKVVGVSYEINCEERFDLRKSSINSIIIKVNNKYVFAPGLGVTSGNQPINALLRVNELLDWIEQNLQEINKDVDLAKKFFIARHKLLSEIEFHLQFKASPAIIDAHTGTLLIKYGERYVLNDSEKHVSNSSM